VPNIIVAIFVAAEVMALRIRSSTFIHGIKIKSDDEHIALTISQLADDTTLYLDSVNDIEHAFEIIEYFGRFSGLKLNTCRNNLRVC